MSPRKDYLITVEDDGLPAAAVGPWAEEKYRRVGMYAELFATGMKNRWDERVYIDLFAGPGHAIIQHHGFRNHSRRVLATPLIALSIPTRFDRYVFCDADTEAAAALEQRTAIIAPGATVRVLPRDVRLAAAEIEQEIPQHRLGHTVLSLCLVDPFDLGVPFDTIARLGSTRAMDFIVLLATDMDGRRNWDNYLEPHNPKVDLFLGSPDWRPRWRAAAQAGSSPSRFLAEEYAAAMERIGYERTALERMIPIKTYANNMMLYYLAFFSKNEQGHKFWDEVRKYSTDQLGLL